MVDPGEIDDGIRPFHLGSSQRAVGPSPVDGVAATAFELSLLLGGELIRCSFRISRPSLEFQNDDGVAFGRYGGNGGLGVLRLPTVGEDHGEIHIRMQEALFLKDTLGGIRSEVETLQTRQVGRASGCDARSRCGLQRLRALACRRDSLAGQGVRVRKTRQTILAVVQPLDLALERGEERRHAPRIESGPSRHLLADIVGLAFLIAPIGGDQSRSGHLYHLADLLSSRGTTSGSRQDRTDGSEQAHSEGAGLALGRVASRDVTDLVSDHVGEFGFRIGKNQEPPTHIDVTAGEREGVGLRHVGDGEVVADVFAGGEGSQALAQLIDVGGELR